MERKLNAGQRILLSLSKAKKGMTWPMVSRIRGVTLSNAYPTLMRFRRQGFATRTLSAIRGNYKSYRFFITEAGIKKLQKEGVKLGMLKEVGDDQQD